MSNSVWTAIFPFLWQMVSKGRADPAVYRDGIWYLLQSVQGFAAFQFGLATDTPTPANYDGDQKTDAAVYREGTWWIRESPTGHVRVDQFGLRSDLPTPSAFIPQMKKYRRIEFTAFRQRITIASGQSSGEINRGEDVCISDVDSSETIDTESEEGQG